MPLKTGRHRTKLTERREQVKEIQESFHVNGIEVAVRSKGSGEDYISLTDLARTKSDNPKTAIQNWMRLKDTIMFLGTWEELNNPDFKGLEFEAFKNDAGRNAFTMTPTKWIRATKAIGIKTKNGRYGGGTYAHVDIAMDFATWISPEFRLHVFQEYRRLKQDESSRLNERWNEKRLFASMNYRIQTQAIKDTMPPFVGAKAAGIQYANEADVLNVAVFGMTARQWRASHPSQSGNMRDHATVTQNLVLSNLESLNAMLMRDGMTRAERAKKLNVIARQQMQTLAQQPTLKKLESKPKP